MKFIAPEVEVLKFNVADVLTTSPTEGGGTVTPPVDDDTAELETFASLIGMPCTGNASDNSLDNCV